jgi:hypothetical protein
MSIAFPNIAPPGHLEIFTLASHSSVDSDITACLWTEEDKLQDTLTTLSTWPGDLDLVFCQEQITYNFDRPYVSGRRDLCAVRFNGPSRHTSKVSRTFEPH